LRVATKVTSVARHDARLVLHDALRAYKTPLGKEMRRRRPRGSTTRADVVHAALRVVDRVGIDALTIRAVATAVDVPAMSLYSHFANKEQLLDLMYAEVAQRLYADAGLQTWQAAIRALCLQIRGILLEHPRWFPLLSRRAHPMTVPLRERLLAMMAAAGIPPEDALVSLTNVSLHSIGFTMVELSLRDVGGTSSLARRFEAIREWTDEAAVASQHPATRAAFAKQGQLDLSKNFEVSVTTFLAGLEARFQSQTE
jgi:AcrR family transcriptional regulator